MELEDIKTAFKETGYSDSDNIDPEKSFVDNNIDSLDVFAMISHIEEKFGVTIEDDEFPNFNTPNQLLELLKSKLS